MSGELIVLVEDDDALRQALVLELKAAGYHVRDYANAETALSGAAACPKLVILDYRLPGMSGLDLLRELRARHSSLPALIISSDCCESQIPNGPGLPEARLIRKPFAKATLMAGVAKLAG